MRVAIVACGTWHDRDVGLGLRYRIKRQRQLRTHVIALSESLTESALDQTDSSGVAALLGSYGDNLSIDQFDLIPRREDAGIDHPVVFLPGPPPQLHTHKPDSTIVVFGKQVAMRLAAYAIQ